MTENDSEKKRCLSIKNKANRENKKQGGEGSRKEMRRT